MQAMRKDFLQSDTCSKCGEEVLKELIISGRLQQFEADNFISAGMAELADAPDLGSGVHDVQVQVLLPAVNECSCKSMESILQLFFYARNLLKYFLK